MAKRHGCRDKGAANNKSTEQHIESEGIGFLPCESNIILIAMRTKANIGGEAFLYHFPENKMVKPSLRLAWKTIKTT